MINWAIHSSHDSSVTVKLAENYYRIYELERFVNQRYYSLNIDPNGLEKFENFVNYLKNQGIELSKEYYTLQHECPESQFLLDLHNKLGYEPVPSCSHFEAHAATSFFTSPFQEATCLAYDGGGFSKYGEFYYDFFKIFTATRDGGIHDTGIMYKYNMGSCYLSMAEPIPEIRNKNNLGDFYRYGLSYAGKLMGLFSYGTVIKELENYFVDVFKKFNDDRVFSKPIDYLKYIPTWKDYFQNYPDFNSLTVEEGRNYAATVQRAFEIVVLGVIYEHKDLFFGKNVTIGGGCALNVQMNQRLRDLGIKTFVPPNPNDCGLSLGQFLYIDKPSEPVDVTYNGFDLIGNSNCLDKYKSTLISKIDDIASIIMNKKIIGIVIASSEIGPRALGNRSMIASIEIEGIRDKVNKIKNREPYRPIAISILEEDARQYFYLNEGDSCEYMSYSPHVREEYLEIFRNVIHVDNSIRIQTVNQSQHPFLYELLTFLKNKGRIPAVVNTSLNMKGRPIVTSYSEIAKLIEQLDGVYVNGIFYENQ